MFQLTQFHEMKGKNTVTNLLVKECYRSEVEDIFHPLHFVDNFQFEHKHQLEMKYSNENNKCDLRIFLVQILDDLMT